MSIKVAAAQISPVFLSRSATSRKVCEWIAKASADGCHLVCFGETLLPAYPAWLSNTNGAAFNDQTQKEIHAKYLKEAVSIEEGHLDEIRAAAQKGKIMVVIGIAERPRERGGHSIYCSAVTIGTDGAILSVHRKLMPTYEERLSWGIGDGNGLKTHPLGPFTVGTLNCWENWMPLARVSLQAQGETLHIALWPGAERLTQNITRHIAKEGRSFVVSVGSTLRKEDISEDLPHGELIRRTLPVNEHGFGFDGGSAIAGPDGEWIAPPLVNREGLVTAVIHLDRVLEERQNFDPVGHYSRPDVFKLSVNFERQAILGKPNL